MTDGIEELQHDAITPHSIHRRTLPASVVWHGSRTSGSCRKTSRCERSEGSRMGRSSDVCFDGLQLVSAFAGGCSSQVDCCRQWVSSEVADSDTKSK